MGSDIRDRNSGVHSLGRKCGSGGGWSSGDDDGDDGGHSNDRGDDDDEGHSSDDDDNSRDIRIVDNIRIRSHRRLRNHVSLQLLCSVSSRQRRQWLVLLLHQCDLQDLQQDYRSAYSMPRPQGRITQ